MEDYGYADFFLHEKIDKKRGSMLPFLSVTKSKE